MTALCLPRRSGAASHRTRAFILALPLFCAPALARAADEPAEAPGALVIDTPAITVNVPTRATYETVTRAGTRLVAGGEHGLIVLSDDNGASWHQAHVPVSATILQIRFATPQVGWAIGAFGVVLRTVDAGGSWTLQLDGTRTAQIMVDAAKAAPPAAAAVLGASPAIPAPAAPATATPAAAAPDAAAPAGGLAGPAETAAAATAVPPRLRRALSFRTDGPDKPFLVLQVVDADHARIIGAYNMAFETADGGKSWTEWDQRIDDPHDLHSYGIAGTGAATVLAGEQGLLEKGDPATGMKAVNSPYEGSFFGAVDGGAQGLFVYGLLGHVYRSTDGGTTWTVVDDPSKATLSASLTLADGHVLFADMQGSIWRFDATKLTRSAASAPWPITDMIEAADGSVIAAGIGGLSRISRATIDKNINAAG